MNLLTLVPDILDAAKRFIPDKKQLAEFEHDISTLKLELDKTLLTTKTVPWVDATIKILYALKEVIIPMFRPLGGAAMTAFGMYCHLKGVEIDIGLHAILDGALPAWGLSRHAEKGRKKRRHR